MGKKLIKGTTAKGIHYLSGMLGPTHWQWVRTPSTAKPYGEKQATTILAGLKAAYPADTFELVSAPGRDRGGVSDDIPVAA